MVVRIYNYLFNQCLSQNLQLTVQSVPITTKVVSSNAVHGKVYSIKHYVIKFVSDLRQEVVFSGYSGFCH
jgi:hypothetical protein